MASGLTAKKLASEIAVTMYDFDPNATTSTAVAWVDMKDFTKFMVGVMRTVGTSTMTLILRAATTNAGANVQTIVTKTISDSPDAVGDYIFEECVAEQIAAVAASSGYALRYLACYLSFETGTDEAAVMYIRSGAKFQYDELTADYVS